MEVPDTPTDEGRITKVSPFHDDLDSAAKIFVRLNSYRKFNGCKQLQWDEILCELAVSRSHQLVRNKSGIMQLIQIGGARFNLGVSFVDITAYIPIEEKDGKAVPVHRTMENAWNSYAGFSEALVDPVVKFSAVSVYTSHKMVCVTIFVSILPPTFVSPRRLKLSKKDEERSKKNRKRKLSKGNTRSGSTDNGDAFDTESEYVDIGAESPVPQDIEHSPGRSHSTGTVLVSRILSQEGILAAAAQTLSQEQKRSIKREDIAVTSEPGSDTAKGGELAKKQHTEELRVCPDMNAITPIDIDAFEGDLHKAAAESSSDAHMPRCEEQ